MMYKIVNFIVHCNKMKHILYEYVSRYIHICIYTIQITSVYDRRMAIKVIHYGETDKGGI